MKVLAREACPTEPDERTGSTVPGRLRVPRVRQRIQEEQLLASALAGGRACRAIETRLHCLYVKRRILLRLVRVIIAEKLLTDATLT